MPAARDARTAMRGCAVAVVMAFSSCSAIADELPAVADVAPVAASHFPDALHAVVWRNWGLVEPEWLGQVLRATAEQITEIATSMGLPAEPRVSDLMETRGYITLIRRNWHLLPYEQIVELLNITPEELAFRLREDDFLYIKLGSLKPRCEPVTYAEPSAEAKLRAAEIKALVDRRFGATLSQPADPRFSFVEELSSIPSSLRQVPPTGDKPAASTGLRFVYSYFAVYGDPLSDPKLDPYPDGLLARLSECGVNGVWLHTVLRQLAPGGAEFPEFGEGCDIRLENLRKLVSRAKRFGIDVYLYMNEPRAMPKSFFTNHPESEGVAEGDFVAMCTSDPHVRTWLKDSLAHVFREVPGLGGVFTITASENLTSCASHNGAQACPRCKGRSNAEIIAEVNTTISEGVLSAAPDAKVIAYDWVWSQQSDVRDLIARLPKSTWLMSVSEWSLPIERGGTQSVVGEYSISSVGPGPQGVRHWQWAKERGLKTVAKVQLNNSWELSSVPYLPVMDLVAEHCENLAKTDIDGLMLGWSLGGYPSLNLEVAHRLTAQPSVDREAVLQAVAKDHFGAVAGPRVRKAWSKFSDGFREYPFHLGVVYHGPEQCGPANMLYDKPTGYASTMVGIPYDDLTRWRGVYPAETFAEQFAKVAAGWSEGLADLEAAQSDLPADRKESGAADLRIAQAAHLHFASVANQARFVLARDAYLAESDEGKNAALRADLGKLVDQEQALAEKLYTLASADSRIGYEASNHYFYVPLDLVEKVINCEFVRSQFGIASSHSSP